VCLDLKKCNLYAGDIDPLLELSNLTTLDVSCNPISLAGFNKFVANYPLLEVLRAYNCGIEIGSGKLIEEPASTYLRVLNLSYNNLGFGMKEVKKLINPGSIEELLLVHCNLADEDLLDFNFPDTLESLDISENDFGDYFLSFYQYLQLWCPDLHTLLVANCRNLCHIDEWTIP